MKHLKIYENFKDFLTNRKSGDILDLCKKYNIRWDQIKINNDESIDVNESINLVGFNLNEIPIKFNRVVGNFICSHNRLTTLKNSPKYVGHDFNCTVNYLTTLVGGPEHINGYYMCGANHLKDMYGFPKFFKGLLNMHSNPVCEIINLAIFSIDKNSNSIRGELIQNQIRFIKIINEYEVIRNQDSVIESRLIDALSEIGINEYPENLEFKNYKLI